MELMSIIDFLNDHLHIHNMTAAFKMLGRDHG